MIEQKGHLLFERTLVRKLKQSSHSNIDLLAGKMKTFGADGAILLFIMNLHTLSIETEIQLSTDVIMIHDKTKDGSREI